MQGAYKSPPRKTIPEKLGATIANWFLFVPLIAKGFLVRVGEELPKRQKPKTINAKAVEIHPVQATLRKIKKPVSNKQFAQLHGVSEATATRLIADASKRGIVTKQREGNTMRIKLLH